MPPVADQHGRLGDVEFGVVALCGEDFPRLDEIGVSAVTPSLALALSRGRHRKGYPHIDPNEDAVVGAAGPGGRLLAALDGHSGIEAAKAAMTAVVEAASGLVGADPVQAWDLTDVFHRARALVAQAVARLEPPRGRSRTALSLAVVRGDTLYHATLGDTSLLLVRKGRPTLLSRPTDWLGSRTGTPPVQTVALRRGDRVVAASDGLTDFIGARWRQEVGRVVVRRPPEAACLELVTTAHERGAGDNVAIAVAAL